MNPNFWDHLINAASHLMDAKRMSDAERQAQQQAMAEERRAKRASAARERPPAPASSFSSAPATPDGSCCIAKRKFKVK